MARKARSWEETEKELERIPVTTSDYVPGYEIAEYRGFVWGTTVRARFIGHDILAAVKTLIGGEIVEYTKMINDARLIAIHKMVKNAKQLGANAIISVRAGTAQVVPGTIEIFCYGTAVKIVPKK